MKAVGIIAEYNPFHNGHAYQIQAAKDQSQADLVVVAMSGNFVQRGEPAIIDKWSRAESALRNGADLVLELPFQYAVQSAEFFASGGIQVLSEARVDALSFGVEFADLKRFEGFVSWLDENRECVNQLMQEDASGESYPRRFATAVEKLGGESDLLAEPNIQLALNYMQANQKLDKPLDLFVVERRGAQHTDSELGKMGFSSGTSIRNALATNDVEALSEVVPEATMKALDTKYKVTQEMMWNALKYQLTVQSAKRLRDIYQMSEGLENRLISLLSKANSYHEFLTLLKTKRYTWTRLQRLTLYTLLQVTEEEMQAAMAERPKLRVLGFTEQGQAYLKQLRDKVEVEIVTNLKVEHNQSLALDIRAGRFYELLSGGEGQDFLRSPLRIVEEKF